MSQTQIRVYPISQEEAYKIKTKEIIFSFTEQGFYIEKVTDDTFLITDDINFKYRLVQWNKFEQKVWEAYLEFFTQVEKELGLKDKYEIFHNIDGINIFYPNYHAIDEVEGEEYKYTPANGIKYREKNGFIEAVIPYEMFIRWFYNYLSIE